MFIIEVLIKFFLLKGSVPIKNKLKIKIKIPLNIVNLFLFVYLAN